MLEYHGGPRPPRITDCVHDARLVDGMDLVGMPYKMDVAYSDVPEDHGVLWSNYALMSQMSKHYIFGPHNVAKARTWMEMCQIMAAGRSAKTALPVRWFRRSRRSGWTRIIWSWWSIWLRWASC